MDDETTPSGIREDKLARAEARRKSRQKDHTRRRHQGVKRQEVIGGMTLGEFRKRFPHLPVKAWYQNRSAYCGESIGGDEGWDDEITDWPKNSSYCPICGTIQMFGIESPAFNPEHNQHIDFSKIKPAQP